MLISPSSINTRQLVRPAAARQESFAAEAPDGYQASKDGTKAGARVQAGTETLSERSETDSDNGQKSLGNELSESEQAEVRKLQMRDREVRTHEQAHAAVGGRYAGSPSYEFKRGPDGRQYANGGEVAIDVSAVSGDPQATLAKMQVVRRAALAPAQPSGQDRQVASQASQQEAQARSEINAESSESPAVTDDEPPGDGPRSAESPSGTERDVEINPGLGINDQTLGKSTFPGSQFASAVRDQRGSRFALDAYQAARG